MISEGKIEDCLYIYTREHLLDEWKDQFHNFQPQMLQGFTSSEEQYPLEPPESKEKLFSWIFRVEPNTMTLVEKEALRHFLKVA